MSEPLMKCRKKLQWRRNRDESWVPGRVWEEPAYGPDGVRHIGGASLARALAWNVRTCRPDTVADLCDRWREGVPHHRSRKDRPLVESFNELVDDVLQLGPCAVRDLAVLCDRKRQRECHTPLSHRPACEPLSLCHARERRSLSAAPRAERTPTTVPHLSFVVDERPGESLETSRGAEPARRATCWGYCRQTLLSTSACARRRCCS